MTILNTKKILSITLPMIASIGLSVGITGLIGGLEANKLNSIDKVFNYIDKFGTNSLGIGHLNPLSPELGEAVDQIVKNSEKTAKINFIACGVGFGIAALALAGLISNKEQPSTAVNCTDTAMQDRSTSTQYI